MPLLNWNESYAVGVERIDSEHKQLIDMINKAYDSSESGGDDDDVVLATLVGDMIDYAKTHFATEAELMKQYGYPDATQHILEHGDFTARAVISGGTISQEWTLDTIKIFQFLADWLNNHIMETDRELGAYLNSKGVK